MIMISANLTVIWNMRIIFLILTLRMGCVKPIALEYWVFNTRVGSQENTLISCLKKLIKFIQE
eukprot:UN23206